ncbi:MAG: hypothetical protein JMN24_15585 [gamma proteobacterium endosymbiont of Lamellibrachia anaximandri]|nr:hypothetical protein [gamma proteobacterium endosymbiont of Lamellibrachia anaximandri]MBL3618782.1 hypothetical protein [gamma proteobacterium endosymbiont of Lamellibrachia anaximandri]
MPRLSDKLLAVLLTLLLGLSPLQGAMAGFAASPDREGSVHQMSDMHDSGMVMDQAAHDCKQCSADDGCGGHSCSSGQCASCALALLPVFLLPTHLAATPVLPRADKGFVSQLSSSLFRPPRA